MKGATMSDARFLTHLRPGQALTLAPAREPRRLRVCSGRLWLTWAGSAEDHWLHAGQALTLPAGCAVVAEAWPEARFELLLAPQPARPPSCQLAPLCWPTSLMPHPTSP
jgi:hypothetical protein